jgi:hypothetical protein
MPAIGHCSLPLPKHKNENKIFYSLFKLVNGRWFQMRVISYPAEFAVKVWGDLVVHNPQTYSIRKAAFHYNEVHFTPSIGKLIG